ncbi:hypothetical protein [Candidatus Amarobacter glycogenicus]|uniref:hypothetical protein n=1 Tax=Candidatus Amarobacter glycogenicus TaxID=3140699 RepID=UPI002A1272F7|nr:hypothetical protein [Dehalococcoidia bacterium]
MESPRAEDGESATGMTSQTLATRTTIALAATYLTTSSEASQLSAKTSLELPSWLLGLDFGDDEPRSGSIVAKIVSASRTLRRPLDPFDPAADGAQSILDKQSGSSWMLLARFNREVLLLGPLQVAHPALQVGIVR